MTYEELVDSIIKECIFDEEGGWKLTNNPDDAGKHTYGGMTWGTFDDYDNLVFNNQYTLAEFIQKAKVNDLKLQSDILDVYHDRFWVPFRFEDWSGHLLTSQYGRKIAKMLYSTAVNMGFERAVLLIQATTNEIWGDSDMRLVYDGKYGPKTHAMVGRMMVNYPYKAINVYMRRWLQFYADIVKRNSNQLKQGLTRLNQANNLGGWINRVWRFFP